MTCRPNRMSHIKYDHINSTWQHLQEGTQQLYTDVTAQSTDGALYLGGQLANSTLQKHQLTQHKAGF